MSNNKEWYKNRDVETIDSPALLIFPSRVQKNIETALKMAGDASRLRPHVKTHKSAEITAMMSAAGIDKFKCATIAEAEMLGLQNAKDVLLAYQPVGPKLQRFINLVNKYPGTSFSCLVDNAVTAHELSSAFVAAGLIVPVYIDLNVGMNRTGIVPGIGALELYRYCAAAPGIFVKGVHAYDGHISNGSFEERKKEADNVFDKVEGLVKRIKEDGLPEPVIVLGGSPSFSVHCKRPGIECSPGTFIYWDHSYLTACEEQDFIPAAVLITRVVSLPAEGVVCTDLGHKAVAAENDKSRRVYFPEHEYLEVAGQSEEHLLLINNSIHSFKPGDLLYAIPWHICPTVALYDRVIIIEEGSVAGSWKNIARSREITV